MRNISHILLFFFMYALAQGQNIMVKRSFYLMGSDFEITVVAPSEEMGFINIDEAVQEIKRIEAVISSWNPESETSEINKNAGIQPVKVSAELYDLIERSLQISEITDGAFDISYASMNKIWKFDGSMTTLPTEQEIKHSVRLVGYRNITLNREKSTVFLQKKGMKIGFGAIGKGYAADKAKALLISKKVVGGIINASGDLTTWGTQPNGKNWVIGITNPKNKNKIFSWLPIVESSVATSGNYEKFVEFKGKKYTHIVDPRTGYPSSGIQSVTILAKKSELCDALATSVFIMGIDTGISLIEQLGGVEAIVVDDAGTLHKTKGVVFKEEKLMKE